MGFGDFEKILNDLIVEAERAGVPLDTITSAMELALMALNDRADEQER
jgi:hypothetical protein